MSGKMWADDTPERLDAALRREQGDAVADYLASFIRGETGPEPEQRKRGPRRNRVGNKELKRHAIPQTKGTSGMTHKEAQEVRDYIQRKNWLRVQLRSMTTQYGPDSPQAKAAAARLQRFIREP